MAALATMLHGGVRFTPEGAKFFGQQFVTKAGAVSPPPGTSYNIPGGAGGAPGAAGGGGGGGGIGGAPGAPGHPGAPGKAVSVRGGLSAQMRGRKPAKPKAWSSDPYKASFGSKAKYDAYIRGGQPTPAASFHMNPVVAQQGGANYTQAGLDFFGHDPNMVAWKRDPHGALIRPTY